MPSQTGPKCAAALDMSAFQNHNPMHNAASIVQITTKSGEEHALYTHFRIGFDAIERLRVQKHTKSTPSRRHASGRVRHAGDGKHTGDRCIANHHAPKGAGKR